MAVCRNMPCAAHSAHLFSLFPVCLFCAPSPHGCCHETKGQALAGLLFLALQLKLRRGTQSLTNPHSDFRHRLWAGPGHAAPVGHSPPTRLAKCPPVSQAWRSAQVAQSCGTFGFASRAHSFQPSCLRAVLSQREVAARGGVRAGTSPTAMNPPAASQSQCGTVPGKTKCRGGSSCGPAQAAGRRISLQPGEGGPDAAGSSHSGRHC